MTKVKKEDAKKFARALFISLCVVGACIFYRDSKKAEKQRHEDEKHTKDFSEFVLKKAADEASADTATVERLRASYSLYRSPDLLHALDVMCADSTRCADSLANNADVVLTLRDQSFEDVLNKIKSKRVISVYNDKRFNCPDDKMGKVAVYYEQYKQCLKLLAAARGAIEKVK